MGNGYPVVQPDDMARFVADFKEHARRIRELERPTGSQLNETVKQLQGLVDGLIHQTNINATGTATIGGATSIGGATTISGIIRNVVAYSNPITTSFRNLFVTSVDGQFGFNLSSRRFKQDIETAEVAAADVLNLRLVTYRYIAAVEEFGEAAAIEHGFIAEEVEAAGLGWLVDYGEDGKPLTLKFHLIGMAMLIVAQDQERRLAELERRAGI